MKAFELKASGRNVGRAEVPWRKTIGSGQSGASLLAALSIVLVMGIILSALAIYVDTSTRSTRAYTSLRSSRYAADAAIKAAINWSKDAPLTGRDPNLSATDPACVYQVPTSVGTVTASCAATAGEGSGKPAQGGELPPEALLLLGRRRNESPPRNVTGCRGWWDSTSNFFNGLFTTADSNPPPPEYSAYFGVRKGLGFASATCGTSRTRTLAGFNLNGNVVARGRMVSDAATVSITNGTAKARDGCSVSGITCGVPGPRVGQADPSLNGTPEDTDPARPNPSAQDPTDIKDSWLPVGFGSTGESNTSLPERTTAYTWNGVDGTLSPAATCVGASTTLVFLPGWYKNVDVLNRYTANSSCADSTFWFAPSPGADGKLLTADDVTGAFYFDFRNGTGTACNGVPAMKSMWCIGGSASQSPRVVVGYPSDWSPSSVVTGTAHRVTVQVGSAGTVDTDFSRTWDTISTSTGVASDADGRGAQVIGDGKTSRYIPTSCFIWCFSYDRAIRVRNFSPKVTSPPTTNQVYIKVGLGLQNSSLLDDPTIFVHAVGKQSGERDCGTFTIPKAAYSGSGAVPTYRFTAAQATQLGSACGAIDLINGYEITVHVTGNGVNTGNPRVYFDGASIDFETNQGASFPSPVATGSTPAAAHSDCDGTKPGGQFIFGGESHVYVTDGSLEICGGPFPTSPETHQVIGLYGVPAVAPITVATVSDDGGNNFSSVNRDAAKLINESDGGPTSATLKYGNEFFQNTEGRLLLKMNKYDPPAGYSVSKITARVAYDSKNSCFLICGGLNSQLRPPRCGSLETPKTDAGTIQYANAQSLVLWDSAAGVNPDCLNPTELSAGASLRWAARGYASFWDEFADTLDGLELNVTLVPNDTSKPWLIPQSGCITAFPNYNAGEGQPDCAIVRADSAVFTDNYNAPWATVEGQWTGRVSVKGTIYAPSSALEVDDTDVAYPLATRGAVLRHLRVSGWGFRSGYSGNAIDNFVDKTPAPREATFTACIQTQTRIDAKSPCDPLASPTPDRILARARVRFGIDSSASVVAQSKARVPTIVWWHDIDTSQSEP